MLQTHVNNDIYNKYCLIHNNSLPPHWGLLLKEESASLGSKLFPLRVTPKFERYRMIFFVDMSESMENCKMSGE